MKKFKLSKKELRNLKSAHAEMTKNNHVNHVYRLNAVILLGLGWSYGKVSAALMKEQSTVHNYVRKYESGGIEELLSDNYTPYGGKLTEAELVELSTHLYENTYNTAEEIIGYVQKEFEIEYSISGMHSVLKSLGFVYKKPKKIPGKSDVEQQKKFIKQYNAIKKGLSADDGIYFLDATHPNHSSVAGYGWIKKGVNKPLNSTVSRKRLNIHGALNIGNFSVVTRYEDSLNKNSATEMLFDLRSKQPKGNIYTIVDNASYYQNQIFQDNAKGLGITIVYLPAYSPNLNLIERLWYFFQKKKIYNKYYQSFDEFKQAVKSFFKNIGKYKNVLATLLTENFNIISL